MTRLDGPDVSHYQYDHAPIQWQKVRDAGCWWGATKLTQSIAYLDPTADRSRRSMFAAGFTHIGLYHWLSPKTDPLEQAEWFLQNLGRLAFGEFAMLDDEEGGVTVDKTLAWLEAVEAVTQRPAAVYTGAYVAGGTIWQSTAVRHGRFGPRPMILAAYTTEAKARALPGVAAYPWSSWQFSSSGPVPGITGQCDMNRVDDIAIYDLAAGLHADPPRVEVEPPATPTTPITPDPYDPSEDDMAGNAPLIKMDKRYNEAFLVGAGTPVWLTGEDVAAERAAGVPIADSEPHPSFEIVAARAGCDTLTARS